MCAYGVGIKKDTREVYSVKGLNDLNGFSGASHPRRWTLDVRRWTQKER